MRILVLNWRDISNPLSGGAELVTMQHAAYWVKKGHTVTWLTGSYEGASTIEVIEGVSILRKWSGALLHIYVPFYLFFHPGAYDVIVDEVHGIPYFSPLFTKTPVIVFIHEIAGDIWDYMFSFPKNVIGKFLERWYFNLYKACIFWTDADSTVGELVERGIDRSLCYALPCPIPENAEFNRRIARLHVSKESDPTYVFVSRVVRMKGIEEVIKAFSFILKEQKNANLWIVGGGEETYLSQLSAMLRDYGVSEKTKFWGRVSEEKKYELMAKSHILLHASVKEGWGLVVLESAKVGTPSVVYNVAGLRDVVKHNKTGVVISDNSPQQLAEEAINVYTDKRRYAQYAKNGKKWVQSLRWEDVTKQSLEILTKAAQTHSQ